MATSLLTALWAAALAYQSTQTDLVSLATDLLEILRNAGWFVFMFMLLGRTVQQPIAKQVLTTVFFFQINPLGIAVVAAMVLCCLVGIATVYAYVQPVFANGEMGLASVIGGRVVLAVMGMLLVEQLYRNTPIKHRWGIKFACLGMGGLFAYDLYLYSDTMLFRHLNEEVWAARGIANALTVPLIAMSAARNPQWLSGISVSRHILFHSAALFGAAIYLLAMAAAGYYLRYFGGSWGPFMQAAFLFGAVVLLVGILFSGAFRSWLRVFISKNFYHYNYDYREEWLRFTRTLSDQGPQLGERTLQALAKLVESSGAALFLMRDSGRCEYVTHWNMNLSLAIESELPQSSLCQFLENTGWVIDLQEYALHPEKYAPVVIPYWLKNFPGAWLVVPLILHAKLFGFVVLAYPRSRIKLNWEVLDLLKIAGSQAASYLAQQESTNALMVARQFESFNRMSTFIVHDLKNLVSQLSLLLSNAEKHKNNAFFHEDMIDTVDHSVRKMKLIVQNLSRGASIENPGPLALAHLLKRVVAIKAVSQPRLTLEIIDAGFLVLANGERLERVIGNLIQNAIDAIATHGQIMVRLLRQGNSACIEFTDNGPGMSEAFIRERLFTPFESTKATGMGIGVFESREYARELGGQLQVVSREGVGTTFKLLLPIYEEDVIEKVA